jgi:hypothetical protein
MDAQTGFIRRALRRKTPVLMTGVLAVATAAAALGSTSVASAGTPTTPAPLTFLTSHGPVGNGDIFVTPTGDTSTYANGAEILSQSGKEIWFHPAPAGESDLDFRTQTYEGKPVLTFVEGTGLGATAVNTYYVYNDHYQHIASFPAGN